MTIHRSAILLPLALSLGSCETRPAERTRSVPALAAVRSAAPIESTERWSPPVPLVAYTLDAPLERAACSAIDQRQKIEGRIDRAVVKAAGEQLNLPLGSGRFLSVKGQRYLFCLEQHYREEGSGPGPTGWHKGVTVYAVPDLEQTADLPRDVQRSG